MENTLARDLRGIEALHEWAECTLKIDLDSKLERSEIPSSLQLESLVGFLRQRGARSPEKPIGLATVASNAVSIRSFLFWVVDPANQGRFQRIRNWLMIATTLENGHHRRGELLKA
jgi:hypothetical protein